MEDICVERRGSGVQLLRLPPGRVIGLSHQPASELPEQGSVREPGQLWRPVRDGGEPGKPVLISDDLGQIVVGLFPAVAVPLQAEARRVLLLLGSSRP